MTNPITASDPIIGPARGDPETAVAWAVGAGAKRLDQIQAYIAEVYRLAPTAGIDPAIVVSQAALESGDWGSLPGKGGQAWVARLNPASTGITSNHEGDPDHDLGYAWPDGAAAARAHLAHLWAYTKGALPPWTFWNPRVALILTGLNAGTVRTIQDLAGTYARTPNYGQRVADRGNLIFDGFKETSKPMAIPKTPNRPKPVIYNLATDYARFGLEQWQANDILNSRFENRGGGSPQVMVFHIQDGWTIYSLDYWSSDVIDASSTVMIQKDGSILRIIPEQHGPWTNGDVNAPMAQAREVLALGGNPNKWSLTIEAEGKPGDVIPKAQQDAIIWQAQTWIIQYPHILEHDWSMLRHRHINSVTRWRCPDEGSDTQSVYFAPVVAAINEWLDVGAAPVPTTKPPVPIPVTTTPPPVVNPPDGGPDEQPQSPFPKGMSEELAKRLYGRVTVPWSSKQFVFNLERSECQYWLARGQLDIPPGGDYNDGEWPQLEAVIRRGEAKEVHVYQWSNGDTYEKVVRKDR